MAGKPGKAAGEADAKGDAKSDVKAPSDPAAKAAPASIPSGAAVGAEAPDFTVRDDTGATVKLADHRGKRPVLLAFYPKDFTGGCTAELTEFGAKHSVFQGAGVQVYGVSIDPPQKHHEFRQSLNLPFPLLADEDGAISRAYGAIAEQGGQMYSLRKIVLIDRDGKVVYRDEGYKVGDPAAFQAMEQAIGALAKGGAAAG